MKGLRKIFAGIALLAVVALCCAVLPMEANAETEGYYIYEVSNGEATITGVIRSISGAITIPSTFGGYPVTSIGGSAFLDCTGLTAITIPDSVTSIGDSAFEGCTGLKKITIPDSVTSIGNSAFYGCDKLSYTKYGNGNYLGNENNPYVYLAKAPSTSITFTTIHADTKFIGGSAFYNCTGLSEITIPDSVTSIGGSAFSGCTGLTEITIPDSVINIGDGAFSNCTRLIKITIPDSVTSIGDGAFSNCTRLMEITIPDSVTSIGGSAFSGCTWLESVILGNGVISIGDGAFSNCTGLKEITIPDSVTSIGGFAFSGCTELESVIIGGGVISIGSGAFSNCTELKEITIPDSVASIGDGAFSDCTGLKSIIFGSGVISIGGGAFSNCTGLIKITIPDSVTSIGDGAFSGCTWLTEITIPDSVTSVGNGAFERCTRLTNVYITDIYAWWKIAFADSYADPLYYAYTLYILDENGQEVTELVLDDTIEAIPARGFRKCVSLTKITIPDGVTSIGDYAFVDCAALNAITIPDSVTSIGNFAFSGCTGMATITIPDGVARIGSYAFYECTGLTDITIADSVSRIGYYAFYGCSGLTNVYITDIYAWWKTLFTDSHANPMHYAEALHILDENGQEVTKLVLDNTVSTIPYAGFENCINLTEITIPDSVTSIGDSAFYNCTGLMTVNFNASNCTSIGSLSSPVFEGCINLKAVNIGENVKAIPDNAFYNCAGLNAVFYQGTEIQRNQINIYSGNDDLENATWHYEVEKRIFADQDCYYCAECDTCFLPSGEYALATVTFLNEDGSIVSQQRLRYKQAVDVPNPTKPADNTYTYVFDSWGKGVDYNCYGNETYQAKYLAHYIEYPVIFVDEDGSVILNKTYHWGDTIEVPANPTKEEDNTYTYTFAGWHKPVSTVCTGNITYQATYTPVYKDYTVIFADEDGREISKKTYHWGDALEIPKDPSKPADNVNTYIFTGWNNPLYCCGNATYTASYQPVAREYVVQFVNEDSSGISYKTYHWGETIAIPNAPTKPTDNTYTYDFAGWDKTVVSTCAGNAIYTATYTATYIDYIVGFVNEDGTPISLKPYHWGDTVTAPSNPTKPADSTYTYTFAGWDKEVVNCAGNAIYTATYEKTYIIYEVSFKNWNGDVLANATYHWGDVVTVPRNPTKPADSTYTYTFAGWDKEVVNCAGTTTYTAVFEKAFIDYTVIFRYADGTVIAEKTYHYGDKVTFPVDPVAPEGFKFTGWDKEVTDCQGNATYTATFEKAYIPGDVDGNETITDADAVYLLYYTFLPDAYPVNQDCDFNGDGVVTDQDAVYLLYYTFLPDQYPIS